MAGKSTPVLALNRDATVSYLSWTIGLKVFFAALALAAALGLGRAADQWGSGAFAVVTVQLPATATEDDVQASLAEIRRTVGIEGAGRLAPEAVLALLEPWLGRGNVPEDLALPVLIDVRMEPGASVDWDELRSRLAAVAPEASVETGMAWIDRLIDLARLLQVIALAVLAVVGAVAAVAVVFATRAGLAVHRQTVDLLHLLGAADGYVAAQFQVHALKMGLRGGVGGVAAAAALLAVLGYASGRLDAPLLPDLALGTAGWAAIALLPVATGALAMATARVTVMRALAQIP